MYWLSVFSCRVRATSYSPELIIANISRGFRMKALLFVLLRSFEFELAVDPATVSKAHSGITRPVISSEEEENRMPLLVRPYRS